MCLYILAYLKSFSNKNNNNNLRACPIRGCMFYRISKVHQHYNDYGDHFNSVYLHIILPHHLSII